MSIKHVIWKVAEKPISLEASSLISETYLEDMIVATPEILSSDWMLIGRQEITSAKGRIDLLALAPDASLVLIEIKRDRTPREVVAQALDYACWVEELEADEVAAIYHRFAPNRSLKKDFRDRFGHELDEDELNNSHQIVIVAGSLDASSERIVSYLNERSISINVLCFQVFQHGEEQLLSRAWLLDPIETQSFPVFVRSRNERSPQENWNGEYYACFGSDDTRSWEEASQYGFISAGGGIWYSQKLFLPKVGDRVWVNSPGDGYVGVGLVMSEPMPMKDFTISTDAGEVAATDILKLGNYHRDHIDDMELCEYFLPIKWLEIRTLKDAVSEVGLFGNQNTVCAPKTPKWRHTVERLKSYFPNWDTQN